LRLIFESPRKEPGDVDYSTMHNAYNLHYDHSSYLLLVYQTSAWTATRKDGLWAYQPEL